MRERVAGCLEIGGRAAFRANRQQLRTQRHLHSAFWTHGAGDIDLPAWWIFLLQTPVNKNGVTSKDGKGCLRTTVSRGLEEIFLDFLYPVQTLALVRKIKQSTTAHHLAAQKAKQHTRSYTSIAEAFITGVKADQDHENTDDVVASSSKSKGDALKYAIDQLLASGEVRDGLHDQLWQNYQDLLEMSQALSAQDVVRMLRCFILSKRSIDEERALALFESVPIEERRAIHYSHAVSAALALGDLDMAMSIHREALLRINGSVGTSAIIGFTVKKRLWNVAIEAWHPLWDHKLSYYTRPDIWASVDSLPLDSLISKAISAANFAIGTSESTPGKEARAAHEFAQELIQRAFKVHGVEFDVHQHWILIEKLISLEVNGIKIRILALEQLLSINSRKYNQQAVRLYHILRNDPTFSPTRELLSSLTSRILMARSIPNTMMVLDEWQTRFASVPARYAFRAAKNLSQSGQVEKIKQLLDGFILEHGKPKHNTLYHCLLFAHSRRADREGVENCLVYLRENYGFELDLNAWNTLIATDARRGDVDGALNRLEKLRGVGLRPDSTTYFLLMSMYGKRGDRDAVEALYEQSKVEGVPLTERMVDAIVLANVNDENLEGAEGLVEHALQTDMPGSRTYMWNILLNAHALRKDVEKVSQLHKRMHKAGVAYDSMTYAALMTSLTVAKYPDGARKIMNTVMPRNQIKPSALHYAIAMGGYLLIEQYDQIFSLYKKMLRANLTPNISTQNVLLRAAASVDKAVHSTDEREGEPNDFTRAKQTFEQTIANLDQIDTVSSEPHMFVGPNLLNEASSSTYFEYLIFLYGSEGGFQQATELYDRYINSYQVLQGSDKDVEVLPPVRLLSALMVSHVRTKNYPEVDRCWDLALQKSEILACKYGADTNQGGWVLRSRRFILNLPLHHYIMALMNQERTLDLIKLVQDLHYDGYALNSSNWNSYIQALVRGRELAHRVLAFQLCEQELIPSWRGWAALGSPEYMKGKFRAMNRNMLLRQDQKAPAYLTLVWLARTYAEARNQGKGGTMRAFERVAPRTVDAITNMPRLNDRPQTEILRQEM